MIVYLVGVPGSGKTYKAVYNIFNNFSTNEKAKKDVKKDFYNCYTNINEFKFDKVHDVFSLDFDDLKRKLTQLHRLYKDKVTDEVLIEKCKEFEIYKTLFVIDEAHNFFDKNDTVLIWWLSYHRHLYQDIFLITQNLSLIFSKYKSFSEYFYRAKSTTVSFNRNTFKYDVYINSRLAMNAKSHTEKLPKVKEVFELYQSGDSVNAKNILAKFIMFSFAMILILSLFAYFYFSSPEPNKDTSEPKKSFISPAPTSVISQSPKVSHEVIEQDYSQKKFFIFTCSNKNCLNDSLFVPLALVKKFISSNDIKLLYLDTKSKTYFKYYCESSNDFYSFLSQSKGSNSAIPTFSDTDTSIITSK